MNLTVTISLPWWTPVYTNSCAFFALLTGFDMDTEKMAATVIRHAKVKTA